MKRICTLVLFQRQREVTYCCEMGRTQTAHFCFILTHVVWRCPFSKWCSTLASWRACREECGKAACIHGNPRQDMRMLMKPVSTKSQWNVVPFSSLCSHTHISADSYVNVIFTHELQLDNVLQWSVFIFFYQKKVLLVFWDMSERDDNVLVDED